MGVVSESSENVLNCNAESIKCARKFRINLNIRHNILYITTPKIT